MLTEKILDKLGLFYDDIAKKKHGNAREFTYGEIIDRIVNTHGVAAHTLFPEIGEQTFFRMMKKAFPTVLLGGGGETWQFYFLSLVNHKYCNKCDSIKPFSSFHNYRPTSTGVVSVCKECLSIERVGNYSKYKESHLASYAKNHGKIRERQNKYKGERALRIPSWSQTNLIEEFYNNCPDGYHVDHVLPLKGELISGLHVLENLQYLSASDNLRKGNKFSI